MAALCVGGSLMNRVNTQARPQTDLSQTVLTAIPQHRLEDHEVRGRKREAGDPGGDSRVPAGRGGSPCTGPPSPLDGCPWRLPTRHGDCGEKGLPGSGQESTGSESVARRLGSLVSAMRAGRAAARKETPRPGNWPFAQLGGGFWLLRSPGSRGSLHQTDKLLNARFYR